MADVKFEIVQAIACLSDVSGGWAKELNLISWIWKRAETASDFILADTSGSMRGEKFNELKLDLREMLKAFINNPEVPVIKTKDASGITKFFR